MNTVLVTGCSSGFGLETARRFLDRGWSVVATMRTPRADVLPSSDRLRIVALDVKDPAAVAAAIEAAGPIDVLVNNAGIGFIGPLEGTSDDVVRDLFETNVLGTIAMTRAVLPQFRERRRGVVVNVTSSVTLAPLPLLSVYTASKAAVNAFTESLALELRAFDVRVNLVVPGRSPETRFGENARPRMAAGMPEPYAALAQDLFANFQRSTAVTRPVDVADAVWRAATDPTSPLRIVAGADALALAASLEADAARRARVAEAA